MCNFLPPVLCLVNPSCLGWPGLLVSSAQCKESFPPPLGSSPSAWPRSSLYSKLGAFIGLLHLFPLLQGLLFYAPWYPISEKALFHIFSQVFAFSFKKENLVPVTPSWPNVQVSVSPLDILILYYKLDFRFYIWSHGLGECDSVPEIWTTVCVPTYQGSEPLSPESIPGHTVLKVTCKGPRERQSLWKIW